MQRLSGPAGQPKVGSCVPVSQSWEHLGSQWRDTGTSWTCSVRWNQIYYRKLNAVAGVSKAASAGSRGKEDTAANFRSRVKLI